MIRTDLDDATRDRLYSLRRSDLPAKVRDRVEMVALSDAGWSPPRIAAHLGYCAHTVRGLLKDFAARGTGALYPRPTGPAPDAARRQQVTDALRQLLAEDRTWTSRQLGASLADRGLALGPRQVRRYLAVLDAGYRRTATTVAHKQDPAKAARAAKVLDGLKKKLRRAG
jgi:putative transposase